MRLQFRPRCSVG